MTVFRIIIPPPPIPWRQRPAIKTKIECARADNRLPSMNRALAARSAGFLPITSDNLAQSGVDAVLARLYALPTQVYCAEFACRLFAIVGRAVATMVISIAARNCERQRDSITNLRRVVPIVFWTPIEARDSTCRNSRSASSSV